MTSARDVIADWCVEHGDGSWPPDESAMILISALESAGYVIALARPPAASPGVRDVERCYAGGGRVLPVNCPSCSASMPYGSIYSRWVGVVSLERDAIVGWRCPDCSAEFDRQFRPQEPS